jgi:DNA-binding NarL/FixJ family response regulator
VARQACPFGQGGVAEPVDIMAAMQITTRAEVLIVEDHPLYSDGLVHMLARHAPAMHCRVARDADSALQLLARSGNVDLVLADQRLPGPMDGLALLERAGRISPTAGRVLISGSDDPRLADQARRIGAMGFLPKSLTPTQWLAALHAVLAGEPWFPSRTSALRPGLTPRQALILERIAEGKTNKLVARELGVAERTVKYHLAEIFSRLEATSRAEAVARASAKGWIDLPQ